MDTCKFQTLRMHSAGNKYVPTDSGSGLFYLQNAFGDRLIGNAGKVYEFTSEENALTWLSSNLARVKNAKKLVSVVYLENIGEAYLDTGADYLLAEIQAINDLNDGLWSPVLDEPAGGENAGTDTKLVFRLEGNDISRTIQLSEAQHKDWFACVAGTQINGAARRAGAGLISVEKHIETGNAYSQDTEQKASEISLPQGGAALNHFYRLVAFGTGQKAGFKVNMPTLAQKQSARIGLIMWGNSQAGNAGFIKIKTQDDAINEQIEVQGNSGQDKYMDLFLSWSHSKPILAGDLTVEFLLNPIEENIVRAIFLGYVIMNA